MALVITCSLALVLGLAIRKIISAYTRRHPQRPIDPAEDRRKAMPWLIAMAVGVLLLLPAMFTVHGPANAVYAGLVLTWLALTPVLRLVGYLVARAGRVLLRSR
jgi:hypothetical protein